MIKLAGQIKSIPVKILNDSFIFDFAEYDYHKRIAPWNANYKEKLLNYKTMYVIKNITFTLTTVFSVNSWKVPQYTLS
jgi:hypothetical protein